MMNTQRIGNNAVNSIETINTDQLVTTIRKFFPTVQAIYLFGSFSAACADANNDIDVAVLFL